MHIDDLKKEETRLQAEEARLREALGNLRALIAYYSSSEHTSEECNTSPVHTGDPATLSRPEPIKTIGLPTSQYVGGVVLMDAIREIARSIPGEFTTKMLEERFNEKFPGERNHWRTSFSSAALKLYKQGVFERTKKGAGRAFSYYKFAPQTQNGVGAA